MPLVRTQSGGRRGGLLGSLFSRRGLGCPCNEGSQYVGLGQNDIASPADIAAQFTGSQAVPGQSVGVPAGNDTTAQLVAADSLVGIAPGLTPGTASGVLASSNLSSSSLLLFGVVGLVGFLLLSSKKR